MRTGGTRVQTAVGILILLAIGIGIVLLAKGLYPTDLPASTSPDFIDNIFDNRAVVWAARLLLVSATAVLAFGGIFIVISIGIRMKNGEWLRRAGPFEISEGKLGRTEDEIDFWRQATLSSREETVHLRELLKQAEEGISDLQDHR